MAQIGVLLLLIGFGFVNSERLHEQIYSSIEGGAACFRRLNGTHQAGCSSTDNGAVGVVQMVRSMGDAQWIVTNGTAGPYMVVVSTKVFYEVVEIFMGKPSNVAGVLIYDNATDSVSAFTQESRCPNEYSSGPGSQCSSSQAEGVWNEKGTGLLRRDIPFPVFYLPDSRIEEIDKIRECYEKFNLDKNNQRGKPLCSVQLNSFMFAAVNSEVCLRRSASSTILTSTKVCDPLGDHNVYYSLFPRKETKGKKENVTLVTARIDTASLFDGVSAGAASSVVGTVTLLAAAVTLSKLIPVTDADKYDNNVLFTLLNGEAFDYIGSQRVAYDLARGAWPPAAPLAIQDIALHVELGQIGGSLAASADSTAWPFFAFAPYDDVTVATPPAIVDFIASLSTNLSPYNMSVSRNAASVFNLPPSSLHSFRRILANVSGGGGLPELLVTDHGGAFTNAFYNSALDEYERIGFVYHNISVGSDGTFVTTEQLLAAGTMSASEVQVKVSRVATAAARALYRRVVGAPYAGDVTASAHLVDEMLYCFLRSQACRLLQAADYASGADEAPAQRPAPLYVGVAAWAATAPVFAGHLLALLAGDTLPKDKDACADLQSPGFSYYWLKGWNHTGGCYQTTMNFSQAVSPAFILPDYDLSSGVYSSWTESVWAGMWARVFVSAGGGGARAAAAAGAAATLAAALLTFWLRRYRDLVFLAPPSPALDPPTASILRTVNC